MDLPAMTVLLSTNAYVGGRSGNPFRITKKTAAAPVMADITSTKRGKRGESEERKDREEFFCAEDRGGVEEAVWESLRISPPWSTDGVLRGLLMPRCHCHIYIRSRAAMAASCDTSSATNC